MKTQYTHLQVPLSQQRPCALLETVRLLFTVPDGARHGILFTHTVLVDRAERAPAQFFRLLDRATQGWMVHTHPYLIVALQPHCLQLAVMSFRETIVLQYVIEFAKVAHVESDEGARTQYGLVLVQFAAGRVRDRQGPHEASQTFNIT